MAQIDSNIRIRGRFLLEFVRNPGVIGSVAPSSGVLARRIVSEAGVSSASAVVEYGPGTGVFTAEILSRKKPDAHYVAIESNGAMAGAFKRRFPDRALHEDTVENAPGILSAAGIAHADSIVSGLPWAAFEGDLQDRLLRSTVSILRDGGRFATFAYLQSLLLPSGRRFKKALNWHFSSVETSPVVWRNLPPAFVYRCVK